MSHAVTIRTTTTTSGSAILLNTGYLKQPPGILKLLHVILGAISVGLAANYFDTRTSAYYNVWTQELFFLLIATTCLITSTLLLFSCIISISTATILPKTIFEVVYHSVAAILLLISAGFYLIRIIDSDQYRVAYYNGRLAASTIGVINAILYGLALFFSCRHYRNM